MYVFIDLLHPSQLIATTILGKESCMLQRHAQTVDNYIPQNTGQKFPSVTQYTSLHILGKKGGKIISNAFSYFT